jgi:hypothetical protein
MLTDQPNIDSVSQAKLSVATKIRGLGTTAARLRLAMANS